MIRDALVRAALRPALFVYDNSPGAHAVSMLCIRCHRFKLLACMLMDLSGPAFEAYYCADCLPVAVILWPSQDDRGEFWLVRRSGRDGSYLPLRQLTNP